MAIEKLMPLDVQRLQPGLHPDGGGLYLQVTGTGGRSWLFRYRFNGKEHRIGLGSAAAVPLKLARQLAAKARQLRATGVDPLAEKREQRSESLVAEAKVTTFKECAENYITAHEASWKNPKHRQQWRSTLEQYVYPIIGALPVQAVDTGMVLKALEPIWQAKTETASRIRGRIESILDYAKARGYRDGDNPARWRGHLDMLLARPAKIAPHEHHVALPYNEIAAFMDELRRRNSTSARCLEFLILTAARTGEAIGATWNEIDLAAKVWTVPGKRMKGGREHRVPLSDRAVTILHDMQGRCESEYVFPGRYGGMSNMALLAMLRGMGRALTAHGFRSTFRDWAAESTNFPSEVAEMARAHAIENKVEAAYRRGDLFEKRRRLMQAWADYCARSAQYGDKVVSIGRGPTNANNNT
jgi:integrase